MRVATLIAIAAALALAACSSTAIDGPVAQPTPTPPPASTRAFTDGLSFGLAGWEQAAEIQMLVDAARGEGEVSLLGVGTRDTVDVCRAFNATFDGIECEATPLTQSALASIVLADRSLDRQRADVIVAPLPVNAGISGGGLFAGLTWGAYGVTMPWRTPGGGLLVTRQDFYGAGYTPDALAPDAVPQTIDDLLAPALLGTIVASPRSYDRWLGFVATSRGYEWALDFALRLRREQDTLFTTGVQSVLSTGERSLVLALPAGALPDEPPALGLAALLLEPVIVTNTTVGVVAGAEHPNAARLLALFMASEQGWRSANPRSTREYGVSLAMLIKEQRFGIEVIEETIPLLSQLGEIGDRLRAELQASD